MTHVSASQIQLYLDCPMKWYREYFLKIKSPSTPSQAVGTGTHEVLERYLLTGMLDVDSEYAEIARPGLEHLPVAGNPLDKIEEAVWITSTLVPVKGFIDLWYTHEDGRPVILDHKTSKSVRWIKTPTQLLQNIQMVTYAHYVLSQVPCDYVWVKHVYYGTTSRWSKAVETKMSREWVDRMWSGIENTIEDMFKHFHAAKHTIPKRLSACKMYGGCFHKTVCQESDVTNNDLLLSLGIKPTAVTGEATLKKTVAEAKATQPRVLLGVNPPESEDMAPPNMVGIDDDAGSPTPPDTVREKRVRHPETNVLISKDERARDFKQVLDGKDIVWERINPTIVPASEVDDCPFDIPLPAPRLKILCIGCLPLKTPDGGVMKPVDEIIAPLAHQISLDAGVPHISLIPYGAGYDSVAVAVASAGWPDGVDVLYIEPMTKGADRIIPILITLADVALRKTS